VGNAAAIWELVKLLPKIWAALERVAVFVQQRHLSAWLDDLNTTLEVLENAKTPEERRAGARGLADLIRRL